MDHRRSNPARWFPRPVPGGGAVGTTYPSGGRGFSGASGRGALGPPTRQGGSHFSREMGRKEPGASPWTPGFIARSFPLARFGGCGALFRWWGCFDAHLRALIWIRILREQGVGEKAFCCRGVAPTKASPWGKLSPKVTDEGAIDLPNGAEETLRWGDSRRPLFLLLQGKVGYRIAPSSDPASPAHLPPRGRLCAVLPFPSAKPPPPARPAGGRAVTGVGSWAAGQAEKKRGPRRVPPKLEKVGPGRKTLFLPGVLSSGFLPKKAGLPAGVGRAPGAAPEASKKPRPPEGYAPPPTKEGYPEGYPHFLFHR